MDEMEAQARSHFEALKQLIFAGLVAAWDSTEYSNS